VSGTGVRQRAEARLRAAQERGPSPDRRPAATALTVLVTAGLYAAVGLTTLWAARSIGLAAPLWPAAGLAFALVYQRGYAVAWGVAVGSLLVNSSALSSSGAGTGVVAATAGAIAVGAAAQAVAGSALVRWRLGQHVSLSRAWQISEFLILAGPVACLVNATVGVLAQLANGVIRPDQALLGWMTWWTGDTAGVLVFGPIVLMLLPEQRDLWAGRRWKVAVPSVVVTLVLVSAFVANQGQEVRRVQLRQELLASSAASQLLTTLQLHSEVLNGVAGLVSSSEAVTAAEFRQFTRPALARYPDLAALSWNTFVTAPELDAFVASVRAQPGRALFEVTEKDAAGESVPVGPRPSYVVVTYIEPFEDNTKAMGYDIRSNPVRAAAITAARDSGEPASTAPVELVQGDGTVTGMLTLVPVYRGGVVPPTVAQRRTAVLGYAVGVYRLQRLIDGTFASSEWAGVGVDVVDVTDPAAPVPIGSHPLAGEESSEQPQTAAIDVNGRAWELTVTQTREALEDIQGRNLPAFLLAGVLVLGLLEAFLLLVTGMERQARREAETSNYAADHDPLTDLLNRRGFRRAFRSARERTELEGSAHVLLFLDLDGFKAVNDRGGHDTGDALLQLVAAAMQRCVRRRDIVARLGGDEFAIVLGDCGIERGLQVARQVVHEIEHVSVRSGDHEFSVRVSVGAVPVEPPDPLPTDELLKQADRACYAAKQAGGGVFLQPVDV
jgi:diguanylate cyclase (GGDEF)-like protein